MRELGNIFRKSVSAVAMVILGSLCGAAVTGQVVRYLLPGRAKVTLA